MKKNQDLIFDVGLHQGEDAEFYLKKGFRVVGFEADPGLVSQCQKRLAREIDQGRLTLVEGAIVSSQEYSSGLRKVKFFKNKDISVWGTTRESWAKRNVMFGSQIEETEVPAVHFPDALKQFGIPHYLKIDIEGCDRICLEGLGNFETRPDYVSIESDKVRFKDFLAEMDLFQNLGYSRFQAVLQDTVPRMICPRPALEGKYCTHTFPLGATGLFGRELPGKWKGRSMIILQYRFIFLLYKIFGDFSYLRKKRRGRKIIDELSRIFNRPVPGWYDTHARHSSVSQ